MAKTSDTVEELADELDFEAALEDLEALVERMEAGEMSLEESLLAFERGIKLTRHCQSALKAAELKVRMLTESDELVELDVDDPSQE